MRCLVHIFHIIFWCLSGLVGAQNILLSSKVLIKTYFSRYFFTNKNQLDSEIILVVDSSTRLDQVSELTERVQRPISIIHIEKESDFNVVFYVIFIFL